MPKITPRYLSGKWRDGYALDLHTLSAVPIGHDEFGHMQFDTTRSEVGELLYRLKYKGDTSVVDVLVAVAVSFLKVWHPPVELIVPVPPTSARTFQPVMSLARGISAQLPLPLFECVTKSRDTQQLKNIFDLDERRRALQGVHMADPAVTKGRTILLFDDLFRSGATMDAITAALYEQGEAADVYALTITRTRSLQ
ncbi:MAG: ComF family protein [Rhodospirillales bacterium]|nr:ComF family protein [Rhodospirillales bacterium]